MGAQPAAIDIPPKVRDYLREQPVLTLATASPSGVPHATTLMYASDDLALFVWVRPDTVTARHIDANSAVAVTIDHYSDDWSKIKGVQASATANVILDREEIQRVIDMFKGKFADLAVNDTSNLSFFRLAPQQLHFIDNEEQTSGAPAQALGQAFHRDLIFSVFRNLPPAHVDAVAGRLETVTVDEGDTLVRQGAPADKFFIIVTGEVDVVRDTDGEEQTVAQLGPGQFFGEVAILRDVPRTATVRATRPTTLLTMDRDTFRSLLAQSLSTTSDLDEIIRQRLAAL